MILYLIRHAWADHDDNSAWPDDRQRPLNAAGQARFAALIGLLAERGFRPQMIATSPLVRCRQTADLVAAGIEPPPVIEERAELAPDSDLSKILRWTRKQARGHDQVAWVGHAPDIGDLASWLIGGRPGSIDFAKGAIAALRFAALPEIGAGRLRWMVTAKSLGC